MVRPVGSAVLHCFLQFLGRPECDLLAGLDLDGLAGRWVPSDPCRPLPHLKGYRDRSDGFCHPFSDGGWSALPNRPALLQPASSRCHGCRPTRRKVLECDGRLDGSLRWGGLRRSGFLGRSDWHEFPRCVGVKSTGYGRPDLKAARYRHGSVARQQSMERNHDRREGNRTG